MILLFNILINTVNHNKTYKYLQNKNKWTFH